MKGILFFLFLIAFLVPCDTPADVVELDKTVASDEVFELHYGQGVNVAEEGMKIYFTGVPENSRCPRYIACYCPGQVSVIIQVENDDTIESRVFTMKDDQRVTQNLGGYIVSLLSVKPYSEIHDPIEPEEYVVELIVSKKH